VQQLLNTLYITTDGAYLRLEGETVVVSVDRETRLQVPLHHLGSFVCIGRVTLSQALLARNAEEGRTVVWMNSHGRFQFRLEGAVNGNILLRQAQFRAADNGEIALELAKCFVAGKLKNSRQNLLRSSRDNKNRDEKEALCQAAAALAGNLRNLAVTESVDQVRGFEGDAARTYFEQLNHMINPRNRELFCYRGRSRRPPRDEINALLSFLYALVLNDCRSALEAVGLDPQLGYLHVVRPGRPALALDLLEEFRAVLADRLVLTLINRRQVGASSFEHRPGGSVMLNDKGRKSVLVAYQERKKDTLSHPVLEQSVEIGLLPLLQARFLARYLRGDTTAYIPYLYG